MSSFAPIVPTAHLDQFTKTEVYLALAQVAKVDSEYMDFYRKKSREDGCIVVLDNGAFELGESLSTEELFQIWKDMGANEVAMADVIMNQKETEQATIDCFDYFLSKMTMPQIKNTRLMIIPQGQNYREWDKCFKNTFNHLEKWIDPSIITVGVAKNFAKASMGTGRASYIQRSVARLRAKHGFDVHLLGMTEDLTEVTQCFNQHPWIRSCDSAKPATYGYAKLEMTIYYERQDPNPGRPDDFFDLEFDRYQMYLAQENVQVMRTRIGDLKTYA